MTPGPDAGATASIPKPDSLESLDDAYLALQGEVGRARNDGDQSAAARAAARAADLRVADADGRVWRVLGPLPTPDARPHFRYRYRHQASDDGERFWTADGFRFATYPSLAATYASRVAGGLLRSVVRAIEPAAYAATLAIGVGLWLLLGDLIGSLPGLLVLALLVAAAGGLWWASTVTSGVRYREASRLAQLTRLAAIGVTGAVAWVATIDADTMTDATSVLICSSVVLVASGAAFVAHRGVDTWAITLGAWIAAVMAASIVIAEVATSEPDRVASAQLGALVAAAVAFPIATRFARVRWVPFGVPAIAIVGAWALLITMDVDPGDLHTVVVVALGTLAAAAAWFAGNDMHPALRNVHRVSAGALAALTVLVALAQGPWDALIEWLSDVPLPVVLVVGGSLVLIAIGFVVRSAVHRVGLEGAGVERDGSEAPDQDPSNPST